MLEPLMTEKQKQLRDEVRQYVKSVPKQLLLDMDADKIRYPREYVVGLANKNLLGLRFSTKY
ncbi:MAG: acyl-CoA dehydrogenase family protein, partial [Dehalococcoidia bacterium]